MASSSLHASGLLGRRAPHGVLNSQAAATLDWRPPASLVFRALSSLGRRSALYGCRPSRSTAATPFGRLGAPGFRGSSRGGSMGARFSFTVPIPFFIRRSIKRQAPSPAPRPPLSQARSPLDGVLARRAATLNGKREGTDSFLCRGEYGRWPLHLYRFVPARPRRAGRDRHRVPIGVWCGCASSGPHSARKEKLSRMQSSGY